MPPYPFCAQQLLHGCVMSLYPLGLKSLSTAILQVITDTCLHLPTDAFCCPDCSETGKFVRADMQQHRCQITDDNLPSPLFCRYLHILESMKLDVTLIQSLHGMSLAKLSPVKADVL